MLKLTKLMQWLSVLSCLGAIWLVLITKKDDNQFTKQYYNVILFSPIIILGLFGIYAASIVLYRTLTFNNCEEAAKELQQEIQEAKAELKKAGFKFKTREAPVDQ